MSWKKQLEKLTNMTSSEAKNEEHKIMKRMSARDQFKLKLKAMRLRLKRKRDEFIKKSNGSYYYFDATLNDLVKPNMINSNDHRAPVHHNFINDTTLSVDISFSQLSMIKNKKSSRTSTPIVFDRKRIQVIESVKPKKNKSIKCKKIECCSKLSSTKLIRHKSIGGSGGCQKNIINTHFHFFDLNENNLYNYSLRLNDKYYECSNIENCCYNNQMQQSSCCTYQSFSPYQFQDFGEFKIWYV